MSRRVVPVSRLVRYIKESFASDPVLHGVMIEGEISNLRIPNSGHWYFSLKDDKASLTCVMFAYQNNRVKFRPKNGDKVILTGDVSVYESMGSMQMIATNMQPSGIGDLYLQFEFLKKKLNAEGLFDPSHKKKLPLYPMNIAVITGSNTAAREDIFITFHKRWPIAHITEYPAPVQGKEASAKIIQALGAADEGKHDLIILARGGGSLEDLWCFNDESLARFIYGMQTPVVTGIGHETDTTLVDFVSDFRANTPTGAVEAATPDMYEVQADLNTLQIRLCNAVKRKAQMERKEWMRLSDSSVLKNPQRIFQERTVQLQVLSEKLLHTKTKVLESRHALNQTVSALNQCIFNSSNQIHAEINDAKASLLMAVKRKTDSQQHTIVTNKNRLLTAMQGNDYRFQEEVKKMANLLDAYSPLKVLSRGYSVTYHNGKVITDANCVSKEDRVMIRLSKGTIQAKVEEIKNG